MLSLFTWRRVTHATLHSTSTALPLCTSVPTASFPPSLRSTKLVYNFSINCLTGGTADYRLSAAEVVGRGREATARRRAWWGGEPTSIFI